MIDPNGTLFVCGLAEEARLARALLGPGMNLCILAPGARERALTLQRAGGGATLFVCFGYCGALDPTLKSGSLILDGSGPASQALADLLKTAIRGKVHGCDRPVLKTIERRKLFRDQGAVALDMESHLVAALAKASGRDWAALRVVLDTADHDLPEALASAIGPGGAFRYQTLLRPSVWPHVPRLARQHAIARKKLKSALAEIGPLFSGG